MSRGGFSGSLHVGLCECTALLEFELPSEVFRLGETIYLGACQTCGRKYHLDASVIRSVDDLLIAQEFPSDE